MSMYLNCNKCGKCCNSGPSLGFDEVLKYRDVFISGMNLSCIRLTKEGAHGSELNEKETTELRAHLSRLYGKFTSHFYDYFIIVGFVDCGYSIVKENNCSQLLPDGGCSIHLSKPNICKSVPFQPIKPEILLADELRRFMPKMTCISESGSEEDIIFREGKITNKSYADGFNSFIGSSEKKYIHIAIHRPND